MNEPHNAARTLLSLLSQAINRWKKIERARDSSERTLQQTFTECGANPATILSLCALPCAAEKAEAKNDSSERLVIYCQKTSVSAAHARNCATYCTPCRPLMTAQTAERGTLQRQTVRPVTPPLPLAPLRHPPCSTACAGSTTARMPQESATGVPRS